MKRFHVHLNVDAIPANVDFYTRLFGAAPAIRRDDYAKWMLEDPRNNFAISCRDRAPGIDPQGLQAENATELAEIGARQEAADAVALKKVGTTCRHAHSNKFWAHDPQGTRWESFLKSGDAPTHHTPGAVPALVASYIFAAYWFTASTSFANPAVTLARALTRSFAGIHPRDAIGFIAAQLCGAALAMLVAPLLLQRGAARR